MNAAVGNCSIEQKNSISSLYFVDGFLRNGIHEFNLKSHSHRLTYLWIKWDAHAPRRLFGKSEVNPSVDDKSWSRTPAVHNVTDARHTEVFQAYQLYLDGNPRSLLFCSNLNLFKCGLSSTESGARRFFSLNCLVSNNKERQEASKRQRTGQKNIGFVQAVFLGQPLDDDTVLFFFGCVIFCAVFSGAGMICIFERKRIGYYLACLGLLIALVGTITCLTGYFPWDWWRCLSNNQQQNQTYSVHGVIV